MATSALKKTKRSSAAQKAGQKAARPPGKSVRRQTTEKINKNRNEHTNHASKETAQAGFVSEALLTEAAALLQQVLAFQGAADGVLSRHFRAHSELGVRQRGLIAQAVYTVLRHYNVFAQLAQAGSGALERRLVLLAFAQQQVDTRRVMNPREFAWIEQALSFDRTVFAPEVRSNLPGWLWQRLSETLGETQALALADALMQAAPLDVRVNRLKTTREVVLPQLAASATPQATPYAPDGLRLNEKLALEKHPLFLNGSLEVQDEGSQLLAHVVGPKRGDMVVDFCAGAGGKTLALGALMRNTGRLYAFDTSQPRLSRFKPRLARSGLSNVMPVVIASENDPKIKRLAGKIDRVLVDAPCTGLGTLRRNPDLKWRQSLQSVARMAAKQSAILASAARLVKPGGRLVYATCSLLPEENQAVAEAFLAAHPKFQRLNIAQELAHQQIVIPDMPGPDLQLWPHLHYTDGFYAAAFVRQGE